MRQALCKLRSWLPDYLQMLVSLEEQTDDTLLLALHVSALESPVEPRDDGHDSVTG